MKKIFQLILMVYGIGMFGQNISNSDFIKTKWFSPTNPRILFESDSIELNTITTQKTDNIVVFEPFILLDFLKRDRVSELNFEKKYVWITELKYDWCGFHYDQNFEWRFEELSQTLSFYNKNELIVKYKVITKKNDKSNWKNNSLENPTELNIEFITLNLIKV